MKELDALREWEKDTGKPTSSPEGNAFIDGYRAGERAIAESQAPQPRNGEYENIPDGRLEPDEHCIPSGYNQCLYCGEPVEAPALYCCEEHEEGRSML
jgi:hypothetical protein